jgi:hypothetical protein
MREIYKRYTRALQDLFKTTFKKTKKQNQMARQKNNAVMHNARGMFAKQVVFKERAGTVYLAGPPNIKENRKPTEPQLEVQNRFKSAADFAKLAMEDADLKASYKKAANRKQTAYNMAFKDAFNPPV